MKTIWKVGLIGAGVVVLSFNAQAGRWLSRDPVQDGAGFVQRDPGPSADFEPVVEAGNEPNLYVFVGNDGINSIDPFGLWKIDRNGEAKAVANAEPGDTIMSLAQLIGLRTGEYEEWLTADAGTAMPRSWAQPLNGCEHFHIPNTVVAYWAGNLGWAGRAYVRWNSSVNYLGSLGFKVEDHHHKKGDTWGLAKISMQRSMGKELHGVYFWGHGGRFGPPGSSPYPAEDLFSANGDPVLAFSSPGLYYHMGLGLVFACDSNSGQSDLVSGNAIWKGFTGTLVPWPFRAYHAKHYIHHGDQATH